MCWEHYNPSARYAPIADDVQLHAAVYPVKRCATHTSALFAARGRQLMVRTSMPRNANCCCPSCLNTRSWSRNY